MLDEVEYLQGMVPDISWCLGVELHPLSIGDLLLLRRVRSPLFGYEGPLNYRILQEAVLICSHEYYSAKRLLNSPAVKIVVALWHWRVSFFGIRSINLKSAYEIITSHIMKGYTFRPFPIPNSADENPFEMQSPQELILLSMLMKTFHMSFKEAINFPWATAHWLHGAAAEATGMVTLSTPKGLQDARSEADAAHERIAEAIKAGKLQLHTNPRR